MNPLVKATLIWVCRILTGGIFIASGFLKGIDPWGTLYKVEEYSSALGFNFWDSLLVFFTFLLCAVEFICGVFLITGCLRRSMPWVGMLIMCFMVPLTLWIAIKNPVADCGCFGEALYLSNWGTFWKNIVISCLLIFLIKYNDRQPSLILAPIQWILLLVSFFYLFAIELTGYRIQPLIDFRNYPVGESLTDNGDAEELKNYVFAYKKNGEIKNFKLTDEMPDEDSGWEFVGRLEIASNETINKNKEKALNIWDLTEESDQTDVIEENEGLMLILFSPQIRKISPATTWKINLLYDWAKAHGIKMIAVISGNEDDIKHWEDLSMADYPIYLSDDTVIKEIVRGNPGIVLLDGNKIEWKTTLSSLDMDQIEEFESSQDIRYIKGDNQNILLLITSIYLIIISFLVVVSLFPVLIKKIIKHEKP